MIRRHYLGALALALAVAFAVSGCGTSEEGVKVTGSVVKGNKGQEGVLVSFVPSEKGSSTKAARTDAEGKYEVKVKPGKYVVVLSKMVDKKGNAAKTSDNESEDAGQLEASGKLFESMPEKYREAASSPIGIEIPSGGKQLDPIDIAK
jgi:hypothetical protein